MGKTNFRTLEELTNSLNDKVSMLAKGDLSVDEIESLTQAAQELYERLVIIRYKSYENLNNTEPEPAPEVKAEPNVETVENEEEEMMMFDFTADIQEEEPQEKTEEVTEEPVPAVEKPVVNEELSESADSSDEEDVSLNDNFKTEDSSLATQFTKAPISDLKSHIGINRKFLYINDLFKGSNEAYNAAIDKLNTFETKTEAFLYLEELKIKENWEIGHQSVVSFTDIVERRFPE